MKLYKNFILIFLISSLIACNNMEQVTTDDYTLSIPAALENSQNNNNSTSVDFSKKNAEYTTMVIKKQKSAFISKNDCIADELAYFLKNRKNKNVLTEKKIIDGKETTVISGIMTDKTNTEYFWEFTVIETQYFYFIIRIYCNLTDYEKNKEIADDVIESFKITNPEI